MLLIENIGECVICIGEKNLIPGTEPIEVTAEEAGHKMVKQYIKDKKLRLAEIEDVAIEPAADADAEAEKKAAENEKLKK